MRFNPVKEEYAYSFKEVLNKGLTSLGYSYDYPNAHTTIFKRSLFTPYGIDFPTTSLIPVTYLDDTRLDLLNLLISRYWDEFVFTSEEQMDNPANILSYPDILYKTRILLGRIINIIEFTYPKYAAILSSYDTAKTKLLDKLKKSVDGSDTRRDNDTPQDTGTFDDDSHTSFISQGEISNEEEWDDTPIIERLDKITRLYQQTMKNWCDEFKGLFIEGGNIHEVL